METTPDPWATVTTPFADLDLIGIMDNAGNVATLFQQPTTAAIGLGVGMAIVGFIISKFM